MCGICGTVHVEGSGPVDGRVITAMARAMTHRGPDEEGLHVDPRVGLGSRRSRSSMPPAGISRSPTKMIDVHRL